MGCSPRGMRSLRSVLRLPPTLLVAAVVAAGCAGAAVVDDSKPAAQPATSASVPEPAPPPSASTSASAPPAASAEAHAAERPEPGSKGELLMRDHFKQTVTIRESLIWGRLTNAVGPADTLANVEGITSLPKTWQASATLLSDSAKRISEGSDVATVAAATADIGRACGLCHASSHGPSVEVKEPPAVDESVTSRMRRHKWAGERLWEGLYVPSNEAWMAGAKALELDPFAGDALKKGGVHARGAASRFNTQAKKLGQAKTSEARGAAYAELLSTCSPCHEAMGVKR